MSALAEIHNSINHLSVLVAELESDEHTPGILPDMRRTLAKLRENVGRLGEPTGYPIADCEVSEEVLS